MYETIRADARLMEHEHEARRYAAASRTRSAPQPRRFTRFLSLPRPIRQAPAVRPGINAFAVAQAIFRAS